MAMEKRDLELLTEAIKQCSAARVRSQYLQQGATLKQELEELLAKLQDAVCAQDLSRVNTSILECQQAEVPPRYLENAIAQQKQLQMLIETLAHACRKKSIEALEKAIKDRLLATKVFLPKLFVDCV